MYHRSILHSIVCCTALYNLRRPGPIEIQHLNCCQQRTLQQVCITTTPTRQRKNIQLLQRFSKDGALGPISFHFFLQFYKTLHLFSVAGFSHVSKIDPSQDYQSIRNKMAKFPHKIKIISSPKACQLHSSGYRTQRQVVILELF